RASGAGRTRAATGTRTRARATRNRATAWSRSSVCDPGRARGRLNARGIAHPCDRWIAAATHHAADEAVDEVAYQAENLIALRWPVSGPHRPDSRGPAPLARLASAALSAARRQHPHRTRAAMLARE